MRNKWIAFAAGMISAAIGAGLVARYQRDKRQAVARLKAGSRIVQTAVGPIECAVAGEGPAILFAHGSLGGYDQGLALTRTLRDSGFKVIAVSRSGYLRSPLAGGRTPDTQADAFAAVIDALGIPQVAMVCLSGGGPSALQFALRHRDRCWALATICAATQRLVLAPGETAPIFRAILRSMEFDFLMWLLTTSLINILSLLIRIRPEVQHQIMADTQWLEMTRDDIRSLFPASLRQRGTANDLEQMADLADSDLGQITAPTLVLHGTADSVVPFDHALLAAQSIPGAELVPVEGADHAFFLTHADRVWPKVAQFLAAAQPGQP